MKFIYNAPAIFHKDTLIVGDTHFGMEAKLRRNGVYDEQFSMRIFSKLKELILSHDVKKIILLGDVKEDITVLDSKTEEVLSRLSLLCEVIIVRGNHDGGIEKCANARIVPSEGFVYEKIGLVHGHAWPAQELMGCNYLVMGHQHPIISITDKLGKKHTEPVWLVAEVNEEKIVAHYKKFNKKIKLILMPAFNPLVGSAINLSSEEHLGPILNNNLFKLNDALVFRLDGTSLGKLKNIK